MYHVFSGAFRMAAACAAALCLAAVAGAQNYPVKSVRIIVPFAAGGPADIYARYLGQRLQEPLGQSFVIDNRPGAGSIIGTELVARSPADGYTVLLMSNTHTINESLIPKKPFALMKDFAPVAPINYSDLVLVVHPSLPAKSVKELVQLAKAKPRGLNYASSGNGTPYHLAGELFKSMAAVDIVHVPYKGSSEARTGVMCGQVELMFDAITTMTPIVKSGPRARACHHRAQAFERAAGRADRSARPASRVTKRRSGSASMAPTGTPKAVIDRLNAEIVKVVGRARRQEDVERAGRRADEHEPGRVRKIPQRRHRQVGESRQGVRRARRPVKAGLRIED